MSYRDWYVGMKVVCVEPAVGTGYGDESLPQVGKIYTIRDMAQDEFINELCVWLVEIVNEVRLYTHELTGDLITLEPRFLARRFRPVQPRAADIRLFTAMLTGTKQKVDA